MGKMGSKLAQHGVVVTKFYHYFLLEVASSGRHYNSLSVYKPHIWDNSASLQAKFFSCNHIAGIFDRQYLWKECIDITEFLHGDIHKG